jgi:hypothetical protein
MSSSAADSERYQALLQVMDKALVESKRKFDTNKAIKDCYGEDASIFGGEEMLAKVVDGMVDRVNYKAKDDMQVTLEKENVKQTLIVAEQLMAKFQKIEQDAKVADEKDRQSALDALNHCKLPEGVSPQDVVSYRAYQIMQQEKETLVAELAKVQGETKEMEELLAQSTSVVKGRIKHIESTGKELERAADLCSMVS